MSLKSCILYFFGIWKHKWNVFKACRQLRVGLWQALIHDWTKFLPREFFPYVRQFYNPDGSKRSVRDATGAYDPSKQPASFQAAWLSHQRNKHHWQAWVSIGDSGQLTTLPIPEKYVREMVADWVGAGLSYNGTSDPTAWYTTNAHKMILHPSTVPMLDRLVVAAHMASTVGRFEGWQWLKRPLRTRL